ncbi:MAG: hypothetical protein K0S14_1414 [Thermomicrobiales bacterium]|jgi:hypothetical protein|nr:hypothetical protein [Thermomicrobiales bacterium]
MTLLPPLELQPVEPVPPEVQELQFAMTICLQEVALADARWLYSASLTMAQKMFELGGRIAA